MPTIEQIEDYVKEQENFECYNERVEQTFEANVIDERQQVAVLFTVIGDPTYGLLKNLVAEGLSSLKFEDLVCILRNNSSPKP